MWTGADVTRILNLPPEPSLDGVAVEGFHTAPRAVGPTLALAVTGDTPDADVLLARQAGCPLVIGPHAAAHLRVPDGYDALRQLTRFAVEHDRAVRVAVTGSVGKTSTKDFIGALMSAHRRTVTSEGSLNSAFPGQAGALTRGFPEVEVRVVEVGIDGPGQMAAASAFCRPHVAVITAIGTAHLGRYGGDKRRLAREKAELFAHLAPGGVAVVPADGPFAPFLWERALAAGAGRVLTFGVGEGPDVGVVALDGREARVKVFGEERRVVWPLGPFHRHQGPNVMAAVAAAVGAGLGVEAVLGALDRLVVPAGRGDVYSLVLPGGRRVTVVDDAFNAAPESMKSALESFAGAYPAEFGERVLVLGDLRHTDGVTHAVMAARARGLGLGRVYCCGPLTAEAYGGPELSLAEAEHRLVEELPTGAVVLFKGSTYPLERHVRRIAMRLVARFGVRSRPGPV